MSLDNIQTELIVRASQWSENDLLREMVTLNHQRIIKRDWRARSVVPISVWNPPVLIFALVKLNL